MNIYELLEELRKRKTPVFTTNEIARTSKSKKSCAIVSITRMVDKKLLFRIAKGIYTLDEDPYLYASYIIPNSFISFNSALYLHHVIDQIPSTIHVVVPKRVKKKVEGVTFISLPKKAFFGFETIKYRGYPLWIADKEKAFIDIAYRFGQLPGNIEKINKKKLTHYARLMKLKISEREMMQ
jgi:predicted transcriptional regulator of viral defense system